MLTHLILCYLRLYLRDYRLLLTITGGSILLLAAGLCFRIDYTEQQRTFSRLERLARQSRSLEAVLLPRPPTPLSFLKARPLEREGEHFVVRPHVVDVPQARVEERSFVLGAERLDWTWIIVYFYSLMGIALTYDAISDEKRSGTLRMAMGRPVDRFTLLAAKLIASCFALVAPLLLGLLMGLLAVGADGAALRGGAGWARVGLGVIVILVFLLFNLMVGLAASVMTAEPESSLRLAITVWIVLAFLVPGVTEMAASVAHPLPTETDFRRNLLLVEQSYQDRLSVASLPLQRIVDADGLDRSEQRRRVAELEAAMRRDQERALAERERDYAELRRSFLAKVGARRDWIDRWSILSPYSLLRRALGRLAGTVWSGERELRAQVGRFEQIYTAFVQEQRRLRRREAAEATARAIVEASDGEVFELSGLVSLSYAGVTVPANEFPEFSYRQPPVASLAPGWLAEVAWLMVFTCFVGALTCWQFYGYDLR